ncbi:MAG: protein kinase [Planctomycetota bacterium]
MVMPPRPRLADVLRRGPLGVRELPGSALGPYVAIRELGRGAFGLVLHARREDTGAEVALKVLLFDPNAGDTRRRRLEREAALTRTLRHPGIVAVLDAGQLDGLDYVAFELVEGRTLDAELRQSELPRRLELVGQVARAVAAAHARGIIHRDLKPANVLVRARDGRALVADFGLAKDLATRSSLTASGAAVGTPAYMAPEQLGAEATAASDVFALGVILYEALTGTQPFAGSLPQRYAAVMLGNYPAPSETPGVGPAFDAVAARALRPKGAERYPDARAFADALDQARGVSTREAGDDAPTWSATASGSGRRWLRVALVVVALAVAGGGAGLGLLPRLRAQRAASEARRAALVELEADRAELERALPAGGAGAGLAARRLEGALAAPEVQGEEPEAQAARAQARVALAAWRLCLEFDAERPEEGSRARVNGDLAQAEAEGAPVAALALARALDQVAAGRAAETLETLRGARELSPFPPDVVEEARARAYLARGLRREAARALEAALGARRTAPRLELRAGLLLAEGDGPGALAAHEEATALAPLRARDPELEAGLIPARLRRAERALGHAALDPADAARALADGQVALAAKARGVANLAGLAETAGLDLLVRQAGTADPPLPPSADTTRVAVGLLELARACAPQRAPASFTTPASALCRREDCPPAVRFLVMRLCLRHRVPVDPRLDLRLDALGPELLYRMEQLFQAEQATQDARTILNAYRTFTHFVRRVPALLQVCWEAEEEALTCYPQEPGRYHVLLSRALTLQDLRRPDEARAAMLEAVRVSAPFEPVARGDTLFWCAGLLGTQGRWAEALDAIDRGYEVMGGQGPDAWWRMQRARCLLQVGRPQDALAALGGARALAGADDFIVKGVDALEQEIRAALGR